MVAAMVVVAGASRPAFLRRLSSLGKAGRGSEVRWVLGSQSRARLMPYCARAYSYSMRQLTPAQGGAGVRAMGVRTVHGRTPSPHLVEQDNRDLVWGARRLHLRTWQGLTWDCARAHAGHSPVNSSWQRRAWRGLLRPGVVLAHQPEAALS